MLYKIQLPRKNHALKTINLKSGKTRITSVKLSDFPFACVPKSRSCPLPFPMREWKAALIEHVEVQETSCAGFIAEFFFGCTIG